MLSCKKKYKNKVSLHGTIKSIFLSVLIFLCSTSFINIKPHYISIAFIKSSTPDFITHEQNFWVPVQQELIRAGRKDAWYMYKVISSDSVALPYDYIRFNVFHDHTQTINPYASIHQFIQRAYPGQDMTEQLHQTNATRTIVWEQLYEIKTGPVSRLLKPVKSIQLIPLVIAPQHQVAAILEAIDPIHKNGLYPKLMINKRTGKGKEGLRSGEINGELVVVAGS